MKKIIVISIIIAGIIFCSRIFYSNNNDNEEDVILYEKDYQISYLYDIRKTYVNNDGIEIVAFDVEKLKGDNFILVDNDKNLYRICVKINNNSDEPKNLTYPICFADGISCNMWKYGKCYNRHIGDNSEVIGYVYYEIPKNAQVVHLVFTDYSIAYKINT